MNCMYKLLILFVTLMMISAPVSAQKKVSLSLDGKAWKADLHSAQVTKLLNKTFLKIEFSEGKEELTFEIDLGKIKGKKETDLIYKPMKRMSDPPPAFTITYYRDEKNRWNASEGKLKISAFDEVKKLITGEFEVKLVKKGAGESDSQQKQLRGKFENVNYTE